MEAFNRITFTKTIKLRDLPHGDYQLVRLIKTKGPKEFIRVTLIVNGEEANVFLPDRYIKILTQEDIDKINESQRTFRYRGFKEINNTMKYHSIELY